MDDMILFEKRFEERLRAFAKTGVQAVDSAEVARAVAVSHPRSTALTPAARQLGGDVQRTRQRAMFKPSLAAAAVVAVLVSGALLITRPEQPAISDPSPSLPGVVAPSSTPSATAPNPSAFPRTAGVWIATGTMGTPRSGHTAVRLLDGRVLVVGGANGDEPDLALTSAELYDPESGTWSATGNMIKPRGGFGATLLRDGRVLVGDVDDPAADKMVMGAEVYDPAAGTWSATDPMVMRDSPDRSATLLRDGRVLVVGGGGAELYDPDRGTWTATGQMIRPPVGRPAPVLLLDGKVLVTGGNDAMTYAGDSAELYDPDTGTWSATGTMGTPRFGHPAVGLLDGRVLVVGGGSDDPNDTSAELYSPDSGTWSATGTMLKPHGIFSDISATVLRDGAVLIVGGGGAELYDPESGAWSVTGEVVTSTNGTATLLLDGTVLAVGDSAELYVPAGVTPPSGLPTSPPPTQIAAPTPTSIPTVIPTPFPPEAGPVPPGARSWTVTVVNGSSQPAALFVAEELETSVMGRLVGSVTPNVVPPRTTVEVTFLLPAKGVEDWGIFLTPIPGISAFLWGTDVPLAGEIRIGANGEAGWLSP